jgi:ABC-type nitrate/sulfonate/bicarbonate transport system substrate-binding protein
MEVVFPLSPSPSFDRRSFLRFGTVGALGLAGTAVLGACGSSSKSSTATTATTAAAAASPTTTTTAAVALSNYKMGYQLSWLKTVEFAGSYEADSMGYYTANGLDLSLLAGGPNTAVEPVVTQGKALIGTSGLDSTAEAIGKGSPLKVVACLFQKNPFCVVSKATTNIVTPADLLGKKIGVAASNLPAWNAFVKLNKLDTSKITIVPVQFDPTPVSAGQVDGQVVFIDNEVIQLQEKGLKTATLLFEDFNYHLGTDGYIVRADSLTDSKKRAAIVAFLRAEIKGWEYALANPAASTTLTTTKYGKDTGLDYPQQLGEMNAQTPLILTDYTKAHGITAFDSTFTATWLATLAASGITASDSMFDLTILPEVFEGKSSI